MEKQRLEPTLVQKAYLTVDGFDKVFIRLQQQVALRGQSKSTLNNYIRRIAAICLHFSKLPQEISDDELTEYLTSLAISPNSPSRSNFKHMVYGLRYYFRLMGDKYIDAGAPIEGTDFVQPVVHAGPCRPHELLFIVRSLFFNPCTCFRNLSHD